ncbi:MAG TPA: hypothetical protein VE422_02335 [Terriglobia bacterium]|nr:hypothetical protein [Terriglobia bacterium]
MSEEIKSWAQGLAQDKLSPEQRAVLETMVSDGQAETLEAAAAMLDWQETVIQPDEHMYGF